jgi:hypothetical protein
MRYIITKADLIKDKDNIIALWKRVFPSVPKERYHWIYESNPSGPATCWLAMSSEQNSVIGATTLFPRRILINGETFLAGIAGDFAVDKNYRGFGPALLLQKTAISYCNGKYFDVLYGFPNKQSELVHLRAGYKVLGDVLRMTRPLKSYYYLKKYIDIPIITKTVSKPIDLGMRILSKEGHYKRPNGYAFEILISFDERFDELWKKVSAQFPIIGERSSSYLHWRYIQSPHKDYHIFTLTKEEDRKILGYIVFHITENKVYIDDLLSIDMEETLDYLMSEFLIFQKKKGIDSVSISYTGKQVFIRKLKEYGFSIRDKKDRIIIYAQSNSQFLSNLLDIENWYLLPGDNDI